VGSSAPPIRSPRIAFWALALGFSLLLGADVWRYREFVWEPHKVFFWLALPLLGASIATAFAALPARGQLATASLLATLAAMEAASWAANLVTAPSVETRLEPNYFLPDDVLGNAPMPDVTSRVSKVVDGRTLYDVEYAIDARRRRITPVDDPGRRTRFALFFGCSFTFGEGVAERETLPFRVAELAPRYMPYNYGFQGYGPQQLLARLESSDLRSEVIEDDGVLIYSFIDSHVARAIGSMSVYSGWASAAPNYELDDAGQPVRRGNFTTGRPATSLLYSVLGRSQTLEYFRVELPPVVRDSHIELTARMLARSAALFREKFGAQRFVVVIFPGAELAPRLAPALERLGVDFLDYSELVDFDGQPQLYQIVGDGHPSARTYQEVARRLARDLGIDDPGEPS
jgi:hypothetical protein